MSENFLICKVPGCNCVCTNYRELGGHVRVHNITSKEYYDVYIKKEGEDKCIYCGTNTRFQYLTVGYKNICGDVKCRIKKTEETNLKNIGVKNQFQANDFQTKTRKTKKEKYKNETFNNSEKRIQTLLEKLGPNYFKVIHPTKVKKTKKERYGNENYNNIEKRIQTCLEKWGVDNPSKSDEIKKKLSEINSSYENIKKGFESTYGFSYEEHLKSFPEYERYHHEVWNITKKQPIHLLENFNKRGRIDQNPEAHHLDHVVSIHYGFINNISEEMIGDISNLRFIPARENSSKRNKVNVEDVDKLLKKFSRI